MKKPSLLVLFLLAFIVLVSAQRPHGMEKRYHSKFHNNKLKYATMENGKRIVLFPDGTWDYAIMQPPPRPVYASDFWGNKLLILQNGKEIDRVEYSYSQNYDPSSKSYIADLSFGQAAYTFDGYKQEVRFLGKELIGKARQLADAKDMAAYHYTTEIYNGLTSKFWGNYLVVYRNGQEIDRLKMSYNTNYDRTGKCNYGSVSFGTANYQFSECNKEVFFLGKKSVGRAFKFEGARRTAAFNFVQEHYQERACP